MTKVEITKIQREVLEAAAIRNNHAVWPIRGKLGLNAGSATRTINQLIKRRFAEERPAREKDPVWREDGEGKRLAAVISKEGLAAIGMLPTGKAGRRSRAAGRKGALADDKAGVAGVSQDGARMPRSGTKLAALVGLLEREGGATVEEMAAATGWQPHSIRGVMSGMLAKKFEMQIVSEKIEGRDRTYRARGHSRA